MRSPRLACPTAVINWVPFRSTSKTASALSGGSLAGSVLTMDRAVRNVTQFSHWNLRDAVRSATLNPARAVHLAGERGVLATGAVADFVVLSTAGEVLKTVVGGRGLNLSSRLRTRARMSLGRSSRLVRLAALGIGQMVQQHQLIGPREFDPERSSPFWASHRWQFAPEGPGATCLRVPDRCS